MPKWTRVAFSLAASTALAACASSDAGDTTPAVSASAPPSGPSATGGTPFAVPTGGAGGDLPDDGSSNGGANLEPSSGDGGARANGGTGAGGPSNGGTPPVGGPASGGAVATGGSGASSGSGAGGAGLGLPNGGSGTGGTATGGTATGGAATGGTATGGAESSGGTSGMGVGGAAPGGGAGAGGTVSFASCPDDEWNLVWSDEFDGSAGAEVDGSKWAYDSGPNWYNGELQYYAAGSSNASLDGNGNLVIEARQENREGRQYTSARLKTEGRHTFTYGRFEGRMKLPYGQGMWPALWLLGGNAWPNDGEIDIMEHLGREPSIVHGTIHGPGYSGASGPGASFTLPDGAGFSDDFHTFAVEWEPDAIRWYVDGEHFSTKTQADIGGNRWVFDHPFFFILNLAVGGEWPGNPDETTVFPQRLVVDYVRVCQR